LDTTCKAISLSGYCVSSHSFFIANANLKIKLQIRKWAECKLQNANPKMQIAYWEMDFGNSKLKTENWLLITKLKIRYPNILKYDSKLQ